MHTCNKKSWFELRLSHTVNKFLGETRSGIISEPRAKARGNSYYLSYSKSTHYYNEQKIRPFPIIKLCNFNLFSWYYETV